MTVDDRHPGAEPEPGHADRAAGRRPTAAGRGPEADQDRRQPAARAGRPVRRGPGDHRAALRLRPRRRLLQPGHRRQPRRLHPLRPLRSGLRRHPGQRRDRPLRQGLLDPDRVRPQRPDGQQLLRHLRRVRAGLPDRGADQQADQPHPDPAPGGAGRRRHRLPVLRGGLRADLLRRPRPATRSPSPRAGAARLAEPAVRQGPVRLGLRRLAAAADRAADPPVDSSYPKGPLSADVRGDDGRATARPRPRPAANRSGGGARRRRAGRPAQARRPGRLRRGAAALPGGDLGGGARPRRRAG